MLNGKLFSAFVGWGEHAAAQRKERLAQKFLARLKNQVRMPVFRLRNSIVVTSLFLL